jgi:hypothetical protein
MRCRQITAESKFELLVYNAILFGLLCFPPQRRMGDWTRDDGTPITFTERNRLDRGWFGYLPTFQIASSLRTHHDCGSECLYQPSPGLCCTLNAYRWGIDWLWMLISVSLLNFYALAAYFYKQWTGEAHIAQNSL